MSIINSAIRCEALWLCNKSEEDPNVVQPDIVVICDEDKVDKDNKYVGIPT